MKKYKKLFLLLAVVCSMLFAALPAKADMDRKAAKGEALILYEEQAVLMRAFQSAVGMEGNIKIEKTYEFEGAQVKVSTASEGFGRKDASGHLSVSLVKSDVYSTKELVKRLEKMPQILCAESNYQIHTLAADQDPYRKFQWAIENQGQNHGIAGLDIKPDQKILGPDLEKEECVIALLDTGIDYTHEDLKDVVWNNPFSSDQLRGKHGYDFINVDADPMDDFGHGSHCAGIMAAAVNGVGIEGAVKSGNVKIMGLKILDEDGYGSTLEAIGAYHYIYTAMQLGVRVAAVNNSWGGVDEEMSEILNTLINLVGQKGAVTVCAAGNEASDNDVTEDFPSGYDSKYILSVAASNESDEMAAFSNYGKNSVDLAAPGTDILSAVSYDCFNPGIYDDKDALCMIFEDFTDGNLVQNGALREGNIVYGLEESQEKADVSVELTKEAYFGVQGEEEKSLKWSINGAKEAEFYTIYFPYKAAASDTDVYDSIMVKAVGPEGVIENGELVASSVYVYDSGLLEDGTIEIWDEFDLVFGSIGGVNVDAGNYWSHISGLGKDEPGREAGRALAVTLVTALDGDYTIYLDNLGVSKENVSQEAFGKYDFMNGTSMAAPYVTGAVAAIASAFPEEDAQDLAEHVLSCTRKSDALQGQVSTGGVLDLSRVTFPDAYIKGISLNEKKEICISGKRLNQAAVMINGEMVMPKVQSEDEILLDSEGYLNHFLEITVTAGEKVLKMNHFFASGSPFVLQGSAVGRMEGGLTVSDGEKIYYVNMEGMVSVCLPEEKDEEGNIIWTVGMGAMDVYLPEIFGENGDFLYGYSIANKSDIIALDGELFAILELELPYTKSRILASYDEIEGWKMVSKLPEKFEYLEGISLAAYQGKVYLLGGIRKSDGNAVTDVMQMDPFTGKWEEAPGLIEARAFAKAVSVGNQLIVTLGRTDNGGFPKNMIFDGTSWRLSHAECAAGQADQVYCYENGNGEYVETEYYSCTVSAVKDGLVYAGLAIEGFGDTFFYQLSRDQFDASDYSLGNTKKTEDNRIQAVGVHDRLYLLIQEDMVSSSIGENMESGENEGIIRVFSMPIQSACVSVNAPGSENGIFEGGYVNGIRHYFPGDVITVGAEAEEGYFVKRLTVNGIDVEKGEDGRYLYRKRADAALDGVTVSAEFGAYVMALIIEDTISLSPGSSYRLESFIIPENAQDRRITWSSNRPDVASVNATGEIFVSKTAKPGDAAVITATAADRGMVKAICKVTVAEGVLPEKGRIETIGALSYKVTKSTAKDRTVTCIGFAGKSKQKAKIPSTVEIDGYTFRVTQIASRAFVADKKLKHVVIGKYVKAIGTRAFSDCTKLRTVRIKGNVIKKIGKEAWKGVNRKAVIQVPKKQKKAYRLKIQKAGFLGKIK